MTAAPRHRQSRSARLRGQLRPSDDRLAPIAGRGHSPAHHPPADHLSASPRAGRSPARHRRRASPRRHASLHLTALRRRRALADRAAAAQAVAAPPRPSPSARACHCRRRRRSTRSPCVVRVMLCVWPSCRNELLVAISIGTEIMVRAERAGATRTYARSALARHTRGARRLDTAEQANQHNRSIADAASRCRRLPKCAWIAQQHKHPRS